MTGRLRIGFGDPVALGCVACAALCSLEGDEGRPVLVAEPVSGAEAGDVVSALGRRDRSETLIGKHAQGVIGAVVNGAVTEYVEIGHTVASAENGDRARWGPSRPEVQPVRGDRDGCGD